MRAGVFITGTGLVTPLGLSVPETMRALQDGQFIRHHAKVMLPEADEQTQRLPKVTRLALRAASEATHDAGWNDLTIPRTGLVVGTSKGPIESWFTPPPASTSDNPPDAAELLGLHQIASSLAREFALADGPRLTISAACASGLYALIRGALMILTGEADRVLVVAAEASVHPLFLGSFKRLGVLPPEGVGCKPFDRDRAGFLMSEAAAAVCLEAGESSPGAVRVERVAMGSDSTHLTGGDPQGRTLRRLLNYVIDGRPVDLIHAHGTGTRLNDPIEFAAIEATIPINDADPPNLYSHKGALGHSLGAAGLVAVVLSVEMHRRQCVLPNVQTQTPLPTVGVRLSAEGLERRVRRSVASAAGFGGLVAAVCLSST